MGAAATFFAGALFALIAWFMLGWISRPGIADND